VEEKSKNFVADGMRWINQGIKVLQKREPKVRKRYYQRLIKGKKVKFCRYSHELLGDKRGYVLIHYLGKDDFGAQEMPHGNMRKKCEREFFRTTPSTLKKIRQEAKASSVIYKKNGCKFCGGTHRKLKCRCTSKYETSGELKIPRKAIQKN
jgi:hypothetical protein